MAWTIEAIDEMKTLFNDGLSASQIAAKLNGTYHTFFSRNAVIGKLHRNGLRRAEGSILVRKPRAERTGPKRQYKKRRPKWTPEIGIEPVKPPDLEIEAAMTRDDNVIPAGQRKTLMQLTEQTCKWPVGDPQAVDFFFCGGETVKGFPYCACHVRRAYQPGSGRAPERYHWRDSRAA